MASKKSRLAIAALVVAVFAALAGSALAGTQSVQSPNAMGYCGPPVTSKQAMIGYYMYNGTARMHAEHYVRAHAGYYHIQADQSFISWLQQPNVKFFKAPAGYKLDGNTYCLDDGTVLPYHGHYNVGGLGMLWWCNNAKGHGYDCTPITKGYCRNYAHGKKVHPTPMSKPAPKPKKPAPKTTPKTKPPVQTPPGSCNITITGGTVTGDITNCSTVTVTVICGNISQTFTGPNAKGDALNWQQANCTTSTPVPPTPPTPPTPAPPGQAHAQLVKYVFVDGAQQTTPSIFVFTKNGVSFTNTGQNTDLGVYTVGTVLTVCETDAKGYTADKTCETQTIGSAGNTFVFTNRKTTPPPPVASHVTNLTCTGQEEITGNTSTLLVCQASNDNGADIALNVNVTTNPGNLLVSGINCSSQGGTPMCHGAGTFEIRIGGINDTSAPIYSDLYVTATSNGVPSSTFHQLYRIDPSSSNF